MADDIAVELLVVPSGFPVLIERPDGWYVEIMGEGRICSVGPTTKPKATDILTTARAAYDQFNREHMN